MHTKEHTTVERLAKGNNHYHGQVRTVAAELYYRRTREKTAKKEKLAGLQLCSQPKQ